MLGVHWVLGMRLGIDVGDRNTDAVLMSGRHVVVWAKPAMTCDVHSGIVAASQVVLDAAGVQADAVDTVMTGTTHIANAFVERRGLLEVGISRLAGACGESLPPMSGWPADVWQCIGSHSFQLPGGYEFDRRENSAFDDHAVRDAARPIHRRQIDSVAGNRAGSWA
jgi:N-methylhydantoinase A/oxoprolinase/acetone carboxylase beta subunit